MIKVEQVSENWSHVHYNDRVFVICTRDVEYLLNDIKAGKYDR